jgi:hypothetical protein
VEFTIIDSTGNGKIVIPNDGYYWFIPFDDVPVFLMTGGVYELDCGNRIPCNNSSSCAMQESMGCKICACSDFYSGSCEACIQIGGSGGLKFCGSGTIVKSSRVRMLK